MTGGGTLLSFSEGRDKDGQCPAQERNVLHTMLAAPLLKSILWTKDIHHPPEENIICYIIIYDIHYIAA